jgi:hypothetical protein
MRTLLMNGYTATVYVADDSDFSFSTAAARLRARNWNSPVPVVQEDADDTIHLYFGEWRLEIAWENGCKGRRINVETDSVPDLDEEDHIDDYVACVEVLIQQFRGVVAYSHVSGHWWWRERENKNAGAPVPSHVANWFVRAKVLDEGTYIEGQLRCLCASDCFEFHTAGVTQPSYNTGLPAPCSATLVGEDGEAWYWFGIKAVCASCRQECLVFDSHLHGCDAFGCVSPAFEEELNAHRPRLTAWSCLKCGMLEHVGVIHFRIPYPEQFLEETEGRFGVERHADAFGWFGMGIKCCGCGYETEDWTGYETR